MPPVRTEVLRTIDRIATCRKICSFTVCPDDNSKLVPPDPMSNSEVKRLSADGSVGLPHVRVGHRQALIKKGSAIGGAFFYSVDDLLERSTPTHSVGGW